MPRAIEIITEVDSEGKIPKKYTRFIRDQLMMYAGGEVRIQVGRPKRTTRANAYYWAAVIEPIRLAMLDAGIGWMETNDGIKAVSAEALHHHFKTKYLPVQTMVIFGDDVTLPPTTTALDSTEFFDYVEAVKTDPQVLQLGVYFEEAPENLRSYAIAE